MKRGKQRQDKKKPLHTIRKFNLATLVPLIAGVLIIVGVIAYLTVSFYEHHKSTTNQNVGPSATFGSSTSSTSSTTSTDEAVTASNIVSTLNQERTSKSLTAFD